MGDISKDDKIDNGFAEDTAYNMEKSPPLDDSEVNDEDDPWALVVPEDTGKAWADKSCWERLLTIVSYFLRLIMLLGLLYMFVCSLDFLSSAFRLLGGRAASEAFRQSSILSNPIANLMMGILTTVLLQSSSTTTSIIVSMVASEILPVRPAIFIIMGANIGTSVTNTIVSLGQVGDRNEFRRAFAGATVHDFFNWLTVIILLPIEWISGEFGKWKGCGVLCQLTYEITKSLDNPIEGASQEMLKVITQPFTKLIVQIDKKVITELAEAENITAELASKSLVKHYCTVTKAMPVAFADNMTGECAIRYEEAEVKERCKFMFEHIANQWSDAAVGACILVLAIALLMVCLILIVKLLHSMLVGTVAKIVQKAMNSNFPGRLGFLTGYVAMLIGWGLTMILQSSSIFTSTLTPLVGAGILHIDRMYPMTLGANIGTTFTAVLAALTADRDRLQITLQVALCHLFFNIVGICIWYPVPFMRKVPIGFAKKLGNKTAKHRWFAFVYIVLMFFLLPGGIFGVSIAGWRVAVGVLVPLAVISIIISTINIIQTRKPSCLPPKLQNWDFLPLGCHSLKPYDSWMNSTKACLSCACCKAHKEEKDSEEIQHSPPQPSPVEEDNTAF